MSKIKNTDSYQIYGFMVNDLNLCGNWLNVYALIYTFSQEGKNTFVVDNEYLSRFAGVEQSNLEIVLDNLLEHKLITRQEIVKNGELVFGYSVNLDKLNKSNVLVEIPADIETIFAHWNSKSNLTTHSVEWLRGRLGNIKRITIISNAIKEYGIERVKSAIDRYSIILADKEYFFDYVWSLDLFCKKDKALSCFLDGGEKWENYKKEKGKKIDMFVYPTAKSIEDILDGTHGRESTQQDMSGAVLDSLTEKSVLKSQRRHI